MAGDTEYSVRGPAAGASWQPGEEPRWGNQLEVIPADRTWRHGCIANRRWTGHRAPLSPVPAGGNLLRRTWSGTGEVSLGPLSRDDGGEFVLGACVSQAWAGPGFGNLAIPRVGQEVIVDFLNEDPDQPAGHGPDVP